MTNIFTCPKCRTQVIAEELGAHSCFKPTEVWVIDGQVWLGDGNQYYQLNLNNGSQQRKNQHNQDLGSVRFTVVPPWLFGLGW
jgi:hypothetical protein